MGIGIVVTLFGGFLLGVFALPAKYVKNYKWENTWGSFFLFAMFVVPVGFAAITVSDLLATYQQVSNGWYIVLTMGLGFLWGCGFCCWGYGLSMVGLSLGYSLTMGTMALVGSMLPFFLGSADEAGTSGGMLVIGGILVCIAGVAINGFAGMKREKSQSGGDAGAPKKRMLTGLLICVLAGVLSSGCNIAFHVGIGFAKIPEISQGYGNPEWKAGLAVWTLVFLGGMISSCGFSAFLLCKNKTWKEFGNAGSCRNLGFTFLMAALHFGCIIFYGLGTGYIGNLGTSVGFAIFQSSGLLVGNSFGFFTGEWKGASKKSKDWLFIGLSILILGIVIVSVGKALIPPDTLPEVAGEVAAMP